ncbi:acetate--CoA ligase family protein [Nocardia sp. CA-120079]|uniref:acetate--CoA ligase family protein n=1 Tax=Nocardia sp. CA-120079 TaxID=3239974 RepID=UPI003D964292
MNLAKLVDGGRATTRDLIPTARLREFFDSRSIAMVGASDNSGWARFIVASCATAGFRGPLVPVHPRAETAFGLPAVPSLRDLPEPVDVAYLLTPAHVNESVLDDMAAAGIRNAIVLAAGYREAGAEGKALEEAMVAHAAANDIIVLGPNCLGFVNAHTRCAPLALNMPPVTAGPVGVALQSGGLADYVMTFANAHGIGLSTVASMGNEAMITTADVINYLVDDEATKVICLFLEEIGEPAGFALAALRAHEAGKPIIALKVGSSPAGQLAAFVHTGAVAGDDKVIDAAFRQLNVIRVTSLEELLSTAAALGYNRWPQGRRMGVLTPSGGACDIIADIASANGIEIPDFAPATVEGMRALVPAEQEPRNPLDVGSYHYANLNSTSGNLRAVDRALDIITRDPGMDFVLFGGVYAPARRPADTALGAAAEERMDWLAKQIAAAPIPVISIGSTCLDVSGYGSELLTNRNINILPGINEGIRAIGNALRWLENRERVQPIGQPTETSRHVSISGPWSEAQGRDLLASSGVSVVPGDLATSADDAVDIARRVGFPVVLKICSAQINHKSDVGGVALGLNSEAEVRSAYERVRAAGARVPGATVEGVLVTSMRTGGIELLAGVTVDPTFGPVLAVGLGGIWVEVLRDSSLRVLPVDTAEVKRMLTELRGLPLLQGARGTVPADLDALAEAITRIARTAQSLGAALRAMEVNPLWVNGDQVEALDILVVTEPEATSETEKTA